MENLKLEMKFSKNGITLIALVITIIVLLILAGVAIATLAGDNGILTKAAQTKTKNQEAAIEEQIRMAIITARINDTGTNLDLETLETELGKYGITEIEKQGENGGLPWKITKDGFIFQITEVGEVVAVNGVSLNKIELKLLQNEEETLTATKTEGITGNITWSSSDSTVATVENGKVTAVGASGTTKITASIAGTKYKAECTVTIVQKVTAINISNFEIGAKEEKILSSLVTTTPTGDVEELEYEVTSNPTGIVSFENGKIKGLATGTTTITVTAKRKDGTTLPSKTCTVTVTSLVGKFVKYDVSYADMYLNDADGNPLTYSTTNGWRLLNYTENPDGTYSNVELISTGIPAKLYYSCGPRNNEWFVKNEEDLNDFKANVLGNDYVYYTGTNTYYGLQAAAGMYKNLNNIVFRYETEGDSNYNQGYYKSITKAGTTYDSNDTTSTNGANLFKVGNVEIRMLTLPELNMARKAPKTYTGSISTTEDKIGLYRLDQLKNINRMEIYDYGSAGKYTGWYWVASPYPAGTNDYSICNVLNYGLVNSSSASGDLGIRPIVYLDSNVYLVPSADGTYFEIQ